MDKINEPFPDMAKNRKKVFNLRILMKSFTYAFAILGMVFILLTIVIIGFLRADTKISKEVPANAILYVNFDDMISEIRQDDLIAEFTETPSISFYDLVKTINVAALDPRVTTLVAEVNNSDLGLAQIQELRDTIKRFRMAGKKAYIYSTGMGVFGGGTAEYYLASAFDEIWMQPGSEIGITGISVEVPFVKDVLEKVGVKPEFYTRYEYKNAVSSLLNSGFSKEHKEETIKLGQNLFYNFIKDVSQDRKIQATELFRLVNEAPIYAENGLNNGLLNMLAYKPDMVDEIKIRSNGGEVINLHDYSSQLKEDNKRLPVVAFLVIEGAITSGNSVYNPMTRDAVTGANTIAKYLDKIAQNDNVKALVLRVNSPGGSYSASNEIWYALKKLKMIKNIPVVVSMGDYAASGGYFVSLAGDYIYAEPSTITGSIGVLGGKVVLEDLWKKIGVNWEQINFGKNAGMLTANRGFSEDEKRIFNKSLDLTYDDFVRKVSDGRKISTRDLDKLARGRIWTGDKAVEVKLADGLGGIDHAIMKAKELSGIKPNEHFTVVYYPEPKSFAEKLNDIVANGPKVSASAVLGEFGGMVSDFKLWQRMKYDAVLPPFKLIK